MTLLPSHPGHCLRRAHGAARTLRWALLAGLLGFALPAWAQEASISSATLTAISKRPDLWPRRVKLKVPVPLPGKDVRSISAGVEVKVVGLEGSLVGVDYQGELVMVPLAQTDFLEGAALALGTGRLPAPAPSVGDSRSGGRNALGLKLDPVRVQVDGSGQLVRSSLSETDKLATKGYLLLQLGGSHGFAGALGELREAVKTARARGGDFAHVLVPRPGATAEATLQLAREGGFAGPIVDPGEHAIINELWTRNGHSGPLALALVNARGEVVAHTLPMERGVDKFHAVLNRLQQIAAAGGDRLPADVLADAGEQPDQPLPPPAPGTASPAVPPAPSTTVYAAARAAFRKRPWAELDALADRVTRERSLSRVARLELEDVFAAVFAEEPGRPDVWPSYLASIEGWVAVAPGSSTARVALAGAWMDYAWLARGHGYADTVTAEGWQLSHERLAKARTVLEVAPAPFSPWRSEGEVAAWRAWAEGGELPLQRVQQEKAFELWKAAKQERERRREPDAT